MKNLQELFVPYELALKLKEKGFNEPCLSYYFDDTLKHPSELTTTESQDKCQYITTIGILAPLYQQVVDWFRIKYTIDIVHVTPNGYNKEGWKVQTYNSSKDSYFFDFVINSISTKDIERKYFIAKNQAIEKALTLI